MRVEGKATGLRQTRRAAQGGVDAALPARSLRFERRQHIAVQPNGGGNLGRRRTRAPALEGAVAILAAQ